jgi:hypothetical protein
MPEEEDPEREGISFQVVIGREREILNSSIDDSRSRRTILGAFAFHRSFLEEGS